MLTRTANICTNAEEPTSTANMGVTITPRKLRWKFDGVPQLFAETFELTSMVSVVSLLAPYFEPFGCRIMKDSLDDITNPNLKREARFFVGQESFHWHAHEIFNKNVIENQHQLDTRQAREFIQKKMDDVEARLPQKEKLAIIVAGEHLLYFVSTHILESDFLNHLHPDVAALFEWHALEEVEHTAVAYDVFHDIYGKNLSSYLTRAKAMSRLLHLLPQILVIANRLMASELRKSLRDSRTSFKSLSPLKRTMITAKFVISKVVPDVIHFYIPGFHPWKAHDKTHLLSRMNTLLARKDQHHV